MTQTDQQVRKTSQQEIVREYIEKGLNEVFLGNGIVTAYDFID